MSLSETDAHIARDLALTPQIREQLQPYGPVPFDLMPLAESYVGFLRYAPSDRSELPPALWAFAIAHRHTGEIYEAWERAHPDLAAHGTASVRRTTAFFSPAYRESLTLCEGHLPWKDRRIFPTEAFEIPDDALWFQRIMPWALAIGCLAVIGIGIGMGSIWISLATFIATIVAVTVAVLWIPEKNAVLATSRQRPPDIVRLALIEAQSAMSFSARRKSQKFAVAMDAFGGILRFLS